MIARAVKSSQLSYMIRYLLRVLVIGFGPESVRRIPSVRIRLGYPDFHHPVIFSFYYPPAVRIFMIILGTSSVDLMLRNYLVVHLGGR